MKRKKPDEMDLCRCLHYLFLHKDGKCEACKIMRLWNRAMPPCHGLS